MVKNEVNHVVGDVFTDNTLINDLRPKNNLHILVLSVPFFISNNKFEVNII